MGIVKKCKKCGKEFVRANCNFCYECLPSGLSESARHTAKNKLEREINPIILTCKNCNKDFILPYGEVNRLYCYDCMPKGLSKKEQSVIIRKMGKIKALKYLGGKCICCGFNQYPSSLEFHHIDESTKHFNIANKITSAQLNEALYKELDKCVILCSNCHRAYHAKELDQEKLKLIKKSR